MANYVIISDLHFNLSGFSNIKNEYLKFYYPKENLLLAGKVCNEYNCDGVIILGDLFDNKRNDHILIQKIHELIEDIKDKTKKDIILVLGNHDISVYKNYSYTSAMVFEHNIIVKDKLELEDDVLYVPYNEKEKLLEDPSLIKDRIILGHFGITEALIGNNSKIISDFSYKFFEKAKKVICGHYHKPQIINNIIIPGSPYPVRKDEISDKKKIYIVNLKGGEILKEIDAIYPKLYKVEIDNIENIDELENLILANDIIVSIDIDFYHPLLVKLVNLRQKYPNNVFINILKDKKEMEEKDELLEVLNEYEIFIKYFEDKIKEYPEVKEEIETFLKEMKL